MKKIIADIREHLVHNRFPEADALAKQGLSESPENAELLYLAGCIALNYKQFDTAINCLEHAIQVAPNNAEGRLNLGICYHSIGRLDDAIRCYLEASQLDSKCLQAYVNLGFAQRDSNDLIGALDSFYAAIQLNADHIGAIQGMTSVLGRAITTSYDQMVADMLVQLLHSPYSDHLSLAPAAACQLNHFFGLQDDSNATKKFYAEEVLFNCYLTKCVNTNATLEFALTDTRRNQMLFATPNLALEVLLGTQGFINEYVFAKQHDETEKLQCLKNELEDLLSMGDVSGVKIRQLALFAMYAPLSDLEGAEKLLEHQSITNDATLAPLLELTLVNYLAEQNIKSQIESFCAVEDKTSQEVRGQYEANPFPRWVHAPIQINTSPAALLKDQFPHFIAPEFLSEKCRILIAGCGTGQQVAHIALKHPHAKILAFDLSKSSIAYAIRMTKELGISNVEFRHGDILEAGLLEGQFDYIESIGVLHHMKEPIEGWRVLTGLLRDYGVFRIGLYSKRGRQGVFAARTVIADEGIGSSAEDIANFRQRIFNNPPVGNFNRIKERADFYTTSNVRDLLFHVQETNYTPKRLHDEIAELELDFVGFEEFRKLGINDEYHARFPDDPSLTNLLNWEKFEEAQEEPLEGYVFWCQKQPEHVIND